MKDAFLTLLQLGIGAIIAPNDKCLTLLDLSMQQWRDVMALAERQGVAAIAFDGVQKLHDAYGKRIKAAGGTPVEWMQWVFECTGMMTLYEQRSQVIHNEHPVKREVIEKHMTQSAAQRKFISCHNISSYLFLQLNQL